MPLLVLQTSESISTDGRDALMAALSRGTAEVLGKPEAYVMVSLQQQVPMMMAGKPGAAAFFEVRSVGEIPPAMARALGARLAPLIADALHLDLERVYSNFFGVPGAAWGHGGSTFG